MHRIYLLALFVLITLSCNREKCEDLVCRNGGNCVNGRCACPDEYFGEECTVRCRNGATWDGVQCLCQAGYEGEDCRLLERDRYIGSYQLDGYCDCGGPNPVFIDPFIINATAGSDDLEINLSNLDPDVAFPVIARVSNGVFTIDPQAFPNGITISGGGEFGQTFLYISYGKIISNGPATTTETYRYIGSLVQ